MQEANQILKKIIISILGKIREDFACMKKERKLF